MDKIGILWIEDQYNVFGREIPKNLKPFFEVKYQDEEANKAIRCFNEYCRELSRPEANSIFPVELVFADYDLTKASFSDNTYEESSDNNIPLSREDIAKRRKSSPKKYPLKVDKGKYSGLLIQIVHSFYFRKHPAGFVSSTLQRDIPSCPQVHKSMVNLCNLDSKYTTERIRKETAWSDMIKRGVASLRKNIKCLYKSDHIKILSDLNNLHKNPKGFMIFESCFAKREIPLQGLFIDISEQEKVLEIKKWATSMIDNQNITLS